MHLHKALRRYRLTLPTTAPPAADLAGVSDTDLAPWEELGSGKWDPKALFTLDVDAIRNDPDANHAEHAVIGLLGAAA